MPFYLLLFALVAFASPALSVAGALADVEVYDVTAGRALTIHEHEGRRYVIGEPQHRFELRVRSRYSERLLAVTSVDGVNVVTGQTAAHAQSGYVLAPWASSSIEGWRKSLDDVARFYFTRLSDSYAARTGRPDEVGVIGVALFRELQPCCASLDDTTESRARADRYSSAPAAESARPEPQASKRERLGTGHGERHGSPAQYVPFERASSSPDELIVIYYDSRRNLIAQGVIPQRPRHAFEHPNPFPSAFVPDP